MRTQLDAENIFTTRSLPEVQQQEVAETKNRMIKPPSKDHQFAIGNDIMGNTFVAFKTRNHIDYIYGMFKGRELVGGHLDSIESWHKEGEQVLFVDHPIHGNIVLVMGHPVKEIIGSEAEAIILKLNPKTLYAH